MNEEKNKQENIINKNETKFKLTFSLFIKLYIVLGFICVLFGLFFVWKELRNFELSQIDNYKVIVAKQIQSDIKNNKFKLNYVYENENINIYEKDGASLNDGLKNIFNNSKITYVLNNDNEEAPFLDIKSNGELIGTVFIGKKTIKNILGVANYYDWNIDKILIYNKEGFINYEFKIPQNYDLYLNNKKVSKDEGVLESEESEAVKILIKYHPIPLDVFYKQNNFVNEPLIKILDESNNEITYNKEGNFISVESTIKRFKSLKEAKEYLDEEIDPLLIAERWNLFLTGDLPGDQRGYSNIRANIIPNSELDKYAKDWAFGVESQWTGLHYLENPPFQVAECSNFEIYSKDCYSCIVKLSKKVHVRGDYLTTIDKTNERMYFLSDKEHFHWYLVSMEAIEE